MSEIGIAYLEVREAPPGDFMLSSNTAQIHPLMKEVFDGLFIMNSDFDFKRGEDCLSTHQADAISYGRPFISNPNLPAVFHKGLSPCRAIQRPTTHWEPRVTWIIQLDRAKYLLENDDALIRGFGWLPPPASD